MKIFQILFTIFIIFQPSYSLYSSSKHVIALTTETFDDLVVKTDDIWIVEFYAPWCIYCQNLAPEYVQAANVLKGVIKVGAVDADIHKELSARYGIRGLPTIKIFAANKIEPEDYKQARNAKQLIEAGINAVKDVILNRLSANDRYSFLESASTEVVELSDQNFDEIVLNSNDTWMVQFHAHWCGHCKALEPHWNAAANELKGKVKFAKLDGSVNKVKANEYGVTAYPDIKLFLPNRLTPIEFDGGRTSKDILTWINEKLEEPVVELPSEIVDESSLRKACEDKELCLIAFFPTLIDCSASCRYTYIGTLKTASDRFKKYNWGWTWSAIYDQPDLQEVLNVDGSDCPILIAADYKDGIYAAYHGKFSEEGILKFLRNLANGNELLNYILKGDDFPEIYTVTPWDGTDGIQEENIYDKDEL